MHSKRKQKKKNQTLCVVSEYELKQQIKFKRKKKMKNIFKKLY